jgi:hypothetical protein
MFISKLLKMADFIATFEAEQDDIQMSEPKRRKLNINQEQIPKIISHKKPVNKSGFKREQNGKQLHFRGICKSGRT